MFADAVPMKIKIMRSSAPGCSARRMQLVPIDGTELTRLMVRCDMGVTAKGKIPSLARQIYHARVVR
jgi:hypothetical protein